MTNLKKNTIIDKLRTYKLNTLNKSIAASEYNDQYIHQKAEVAKTVIGNTSGLLDDTACREQLAYHYHTMKARYQSKPLVTKLADSAKRDEYWGRVLARCKAADVSPELFMKAQFDFFHKAFGTFPKLNHLVTDAATVRATLYKGSNSSVVSSAKEVTLPKGALFAHCEKQIREICKAQGITREEYYRRFILTGILSMPKEFITADPVYTKVLNDTK